MPCFSIRRRPPDFVRIEKSGDLIYWTYFMIDWEKVKQTPSDVKCSECGSPMCLAEPAIDAKGNRYDGYVCHTDKRVVWVKGA
jgi:hypothetical protein